LHYSQRLRGRWRRKLFWYWRCNESRLSICMAIKLIRSFSRRLWKRTRSINARSRHFNSRLLLLRHRVLLLHYRRRWSIPRDVVLCASDSILRMFTCATVRVLCRRRLLVFVFGGGHSMALRRDGRNVTGTDQFCFIRRAVFRCLRTLSTTSSSVIVILLTGKASCHG